jgi:tetratricopeptide (TPR) repeat protein
LRALRPRMMPAEEAALDMYEADMAGDSYERLEATRRLSKIRSGSAEMPVLVGVTCLYIGHPAEALAAFKETDGDHGLNAITPVYWGWLGIAQHFAGDTVGERATAREGVKRHPHNRLTVGSAVAWAARSGDTAAIAEQLENRLTDDGDTTLARREMTLFAGRELRAHGHPDAAAAMFRRVLDETTRPTDNSLRARTQAAYARYELGQYDAARPMFEALRIADQTNVDVIGRLGALAVRLKDSVTATRFDNELGQMKQPYLFGRAKKWRAHIAALRGRTGEALSMLEAATKDGYRFMDSAVIDIHHDADFVDLIATPEYKKFLRQMAEITRK